MYLTTVPVAWLGCEEEGEQEQKECHDRDNLNIKQNIRLTVVVVQAVLRILSDPEQCFWLVRIRIRALLFTLKYTYIGINNFYIKLIGKQRRHFNTSSSFIFKGAGLIWTQPKLVSGPLKSSFRSNKVQVVNNVKYFLNNKHLRVRIQEHRLRV